jgi:opacity protein-like surface antigen
MMVLVGSSVSVGVASAQEEYSFPEGAGPYAWIEAGPTFYQNGQLRTFGVPTSEPVHYRVGGSGDVDFGYAFDKYVAAGIELGINGTRIDNISGYDLHGADLYNIPFLANVTLSYPIPHTFLTPYIGGGAGGADSILDSRHISDGFTEVRGAENDVVFAWEAYAGLRFQFRRNMSLGIGYKYFGTGNPNFGYPPSPRFNVGFKGVETHSIVASFTVSFW